MGDAQMSSWPTQATRQGQQSIAMHDEAVLLAGNGSRTRRRRTCRASDARLAVLSALWEGHFGDSAEAAGDCGKAYKPFSGPESLGETGSAHTDPPKAALQGR